MKNNLFQSNIKLFSLLRNFILLIRNTQTVVMCNTWKCWQFLTRAGDHELCVAVDATCQNELVLLYINEIRKLFLDKNIIIITNAW